MTTANPSTLDDALRRFDRLAALSDAELARLAEQIEPLEAAAGTCLLELGCSDDRMLFLLEGELDMVAGDGAAHRVRHTDVAARGPLSCLRPSRYRVVARTRARYLLLDRALLEQLPHGSPTGSMLVEETYLGAEPNELIHDSATHPLMFDVFEDLNNERVLVPSEPDIALRVGRALDRAAGNPDRLADLLAVCPALTVKLIRAAMAEGVPPQQIRSARDAVTGLGVDRAYDLAVNCVLRESLRTASGVVGRRMRSWWERTIRVASICTVLARNSDHLEPAYAGLVGLLHSIAEPVLLGFADQHPDLADATALDNLVYDNRCEVGRILLNRWGMPHEIVEAATLCNHWQYRHASQADYTDLVLVAQWHAGIGGKRDRPRPPVDRIPAFDRLGLVPPSPALSLKIVEAADSAIGRTDRLLDA